MATGECVCNIKNGKPLIAHRVNIIANPHKVSRNSVDLCDFGEVLISLATPARFRETVYIYLTL